MPPLVDLTSGMEPFALPRSHVRIIRSRSGEPYRLLLAWPGEPPPEFGYPVVYLLDANASFGSLVEGIRMRSRRSDATGVLPAVVVGVDYPLDEPERTRRRTFDCTPSIAVSPAAPGRSGAGAGESGGAEPFLDLLVGVVREAIPRSLHVDPRRQILVGHSLAGLFVLNTLITAPSSFETYVAISPSIWWDRDRLRAVADAAALSSSRVFVAAGEYEQTLAPWQQARSGESIEAVAERRRHRRMVDDARDLTSCLAKSAAAVMFDELAGEDHASALGVGLQRCLRFCLAPRP